MDEKPWSHISATKEDVKLLWEEFGRIKDIAEQHDFPVLLAIDIKYTPFYNDLMNNWDDYHAQLFVYGLAESLKRFDLK